MFPASSGGRLGSYQQASWPDQAANVRFLEWLSCSRNPLAASTSSVVGGAVGTDGESLDSFESSFENDLHKLWNGMSSGSYFHPPVGSAEMPKRRRRRMLGSPTGADRVAQTVVNIYFEPRVQPYFHLDSYGYRPAEPVAGALAVTRERCWKYDWVLEFDIKVLFDNINHGLSMKAVRKNTDNPWIILYIERRLKVPFQMPNGAIAERTKRTLHRAA